MKKLLQPKKHCQGVNICLVGTNRFQNDLLVGNLKKIHGCECNFIVSSCISRIPEIVWDGSSQRAMICVDCHGLDIIALKNLLCTINELVLPRHTLALFNVPPRKGLEKKVLSYGVRGFFYPDNSPDDFCRGIRGLFRGDLWLNRELLTNIILEEITPYSGQNHQAGKNLEKLSKREREILELLKTGAKNEDIAEELFLSSHTIRTHLYNIYRKIGVTNRTKAASWASKHLN